MKILRANQTPAQMQGPDTPSKLRQPTNINKNPFKKKPISTTQTRKRKLDEQPRKLQVKQNIEPRIKRDIASRKPRKENDLRLVNSSNDTDEALEEFQDVAKRLCVSIEESDSKASDIAERLLEKDQISI